MIILSEKAVMNALKRINEVKYPWRKAEGNLEEVNVPDSVQEDFTSWVSAKANRQQQFGQNSVLGLMYDYYFNDNDQALYEIVEQYKNDMGIQTEEDSNEDIYLYNQIRLAVEAWGKYANDSEEEPEPMEEQAYGDLEEDDMMDGGEIAMLKESIKSMIRESLFNAGMTPRMMPQRPVDTQERGHGTWKSKHNNQNLHFKEKPKTGKERRQSKRATVIRWLRDPSVNCAEIMRLLWDPAPEDEDTKRGEFYKKRDGAINKDSGARYSFSDEEINSLYKIKSGRS